MKTVILGHEAGKPIWHQGFLNFANDMGFIIKICKIRRPQTKGKVERLVKYVKDNFMAGRTFSDINDLNLQAKAWCDKVNAKISASTGEKPFERLYEEELNSLPDTKITDRYRYESRFVSKDGFINYYGVRYGVPLEYSGRNLTVRAKNGQLEIFNGITLVAKHSIEGKSGKIIWLKEQYQGLAEKHGLTFMPSAVQVSNPVESRELSIYEKILEVGNG